jgi:hypothetical protein
MLHREPAVDGVSNADHSGAVLSRWPTVSNRIFRWSNAKIGIVRNFERALASGFRWTTFGDDLDPPRQAPE